MARLRMFGPAREAAGVNAERFEGSSVEEILAEATRRFGPAFSEVLSYSTVWVNGHDATRAAPVSDDDEVAVIPPVSGGS